MNETPNTRTAELFDAMVAAYETWAEPLSARLAQVALKRTSVRAGDRVLDIGAGTGALALQAAALGARVTAIDLSSAMVARLTQRLAPYPECKALVMDGQALTFEESTFDAAFSILSTTVFPDWGAGLDEAVRVVRPGGWLGIVHWANPEGADIFTILSRALKKLPLAAGSPDAPKLTALMSVHELRAALEDRKCELMEVEPLDAPSPLPAPESFMDTLDSIYRSLPTYRSLDEQLRGELRILLAEEAHRWIKEDVPAGRTATARLAIARRLFHTGDHLVSEMDRGVGRSSSSRSSAMPLSAAKPFLTEESLENPYPTYKRFLEEGPIHYLNFRGRRFWAVFSYADCSTGLRDLRLSARRADSLLLSLSAEQRSQYAELARLLNLWMLFRDAPQHSRLRKLMNTGFSPAVVESLRLRVESMVDRMLDVLPSDSEVDLLGEIAHPLPVRVIAEMLGIADTKQEWLVRSSDAIAAFFGNPARTEEQVRAAQDALVELTQFFAKTVPERRKHKGSDLISLLLDIEEEGEVLTEEELHAQCVMLLFGGHETTRNLIGNGMYTLLGHPKEAAELRENPELIRSAVEELLRYESPVQYTGRIALEDLDICGVPLRRGEPIMFLLAAANRDPQRFEDPDRLNLGRANNPHLAFGAGAHFCIGNQLARLEGQVAIWKLLQKFPRMRLAQPKMQWIPSHGLRGLKELRVVL